VATLLDLANQMDALEKRVKAASKSTTDEVALSILNDLVQVTPVDVGTAISNWQLSLDAPALDIVPAYAPSPKGRTKAGVWTHAVDPIITSQNNLPLILDAAKRVLAARQLGQTIYLANNLPYIQELNDGSSEQAPSGFVDRALILGREVVARVKL
jgi:hypothetical protein